jgi:hypothetical protein
MFTCDAAGRRRGGVAAQGQHARGVSPTDRSSWGRTAEATSERANQPTDGAGDFIARRMRMAEAEITLGFQEEQGAEPRDVWCGGLGLRCAPALVDGFGLSLLLRALRIGGVLGFARGGANGRRATSDGRAGTWRRQPGRSLA